MIKILFLIPNLGHGGAEKVLVNLVNHMNLNLFEITVMALYDEGVNRKFLSQNVKYKFFLKKSFHGIGHVLKVFPPRLLYRFIIRDSFDIVVSYLEGQTARIIGGCFDHRIKKVCWIHRTMTTKKDASRLFRNEKEAEKCYESFDYIVSVSKDVEKSFLKIFPVMRSTVLYNTNQTDLILKKAQEPIAESLFEHSEFNICGMGSLIPVKGFDRLIRVHYRLKKLGFPVHTYILGEGNEKGSLLKLIRNLKLENSVTLLGYSENPYKYLKKCDLFVCSSLSEGFSTAVTEALVLGIPVCTVNVSGMKELLGNNNEYGIVTDNDEEALYKGIKHLLDDNELLQHYKSQALIRGGEFQTDNTVKAVENMFVELISEKAE